MNHAHYVPDDIDECLKAVIDADDLIGPTFIGQGLSRSVGSDCYGYYIVEMKTTSKGKPLIGIAGACTKFAVSWTDGSEECSIELKTAKPTEWITTYGKNKDGGPKWWYCDETGDRKSAKIFHRGKAYFCWNGASAYRDPSF